MTADEDDDRVDHLDPDPPTPAGRRLLLLATTAVVAVGLVLSIALARPPEQSAPVPEPTADDTPGPSRTPSPSPRPVPPDDSPVRGAFGAAVLADADPGWELFAQTSRELYRIDLATGGFTRTRSWIGTDSSGLSSAMVPSDDAVLVHEYPSVVADLVPDDEPRRDVAFDALGSGSQVLPGPPGSIWILAGLGAEEVTLGRYSLTGEGLGRPQPVGGLFGGVAYGDDAGRVLVAGVGGVWLLGDQPPQRVTRGQVLGVGPTTLVTVDCDDAMRCERRVHDRRTGDERALGPARDSDRHLYAPGRTSPDGRWLAEPSVFDGGYRLVDLGTGEEVTTIASAIDYADATQSAVWTPDNRLLLLVDGRLTVLDPVSGRAVTPEIDLPGVRRLALRT